jgi:photosystem II stability/assembly factor-like uncharacterized protein
LKLKYFRAPALFFVVFSAALRLFACGDFFPNNLLSGGDGAVLAAPVADFENELERLHLATNSIRAMITTNTYAKDSADAELSDLRRELALLGTPTSMAKTIIKAHQIERGKLQAFEDSIEDDDRVVWDGTNYVHGPIYPPISPPTTQTLPAPPVGPSQDSNPPASPMPPPSPFPDVRITPGLPAEFANYFAGAIAWENPAFPNSDAACVSWEKVLALPPAQRHFKSTWAAFMLGKYWAGKDPQKAIGYFQQTRQFAAMGFIDSCGLAAASFGLEALAELRRKNFEMAMLLYLQQLGTGDGSALASLEFTAQHALATNDPVALKQLAVNPVTQRVVTAYLISWEPGLYKDGQAASWLDAVEGAGVRDVDSAEELALAAYQAGEWDAARRWAERAPASPVSQWLEAKLLLRGGKINEAAAMLARVVKLMEAKNNGVSNQLKDDLQVDCEQSEAFIDPSNQVLGELGVLHLSQRDYVESLDALLRSGFWMDAAYVAERILTVGELKAYVDRNWPAVSSTNDERAVPEDATDARNDIRYLLARRLVRLKRNDEARVYYPPQLRTQFDALVNDLKAARNKGLLPDRCAKALFAAAMMTRTNGMELLGTELKPDWLIYGGNFEDGDTIRTNENTKLLAPSVDELRRYAENDVNLEERFHYRYQAAELAVEAAKLMPDNSEDTARVLCTAGSWIKLLDPQKADTIYKTLVRRCRNTEIGWEADLMRWFPSLDNSGNPIPNKPRAKQKYLIYRDRLGHLDISLFHNYIGTVHMMDRQNGWAENVTTVLETNEWVFEQNSILRTTNGGASWKAVLWASPEDSVALFAFDKDTAWVTAVYDESTNVSIFETSDGGQSWGSAELSVAFPVEDCEFSIPALDESSEQTNLPPGAVPVYDPSFSVPDPKKLLLIPDHGMNSMPGYLYGVDGNGTWQLINSTENNEEKGGDWEGSAPGFSDRHSYLTCGGQILFQDSTNGWLMGQLTTTTRPFLFFTQDGGINWQEQKFVSPTALSNGAIQPCALPRFFGTNGIVETSFVPNDRDSTNFYKVFYGTHDSGQTWQPTTPIKLDGVSSFISSETGWIWSPESHNSNSRAPVKGLLYRTDDGGHTWKPISASLENFLTHGESLIQLDFVDDCGWAIAQDWRNKTQLLKTTDGGETWNVLNR